MPIHPTAIVSEKANIHDSVDVGPYAIIEEGTEIGEKSVIAAQAQVRRGTKLGKNNFVGSGAILGADPQFAGFDSTFATAVEAGDDNVFREYVTVHRSIYEGKATRVGDGNYLMTGAHLGHDVILGDQNTIANNCLLAGHVEVGNCCFLGGGAVFHQFVRLGNYVMVQGLGGVGMDVPHFLIETEINRIGGVNIVGLRRAGMEPATRTQIKKAFSLIYQRKLPPSEVRGHFRADELSKEVEDFLQFIENPGKRGVCLKLRND